MDSPQISRVIEWNQERGFGFLADETGNGRIFLHIREIVSGARPPRVGDMISFTLGEDMKGRPQATQATNDRAAVKLPLKSWIALVILLVLPALALSTLPLPILCYWLGVFGLFVSHVTYVFYFRDKKSAEAGKSRISENRLHILELIGGWPGAFIAQRSLRHKSSKASYKFMFWVIIIGHQIVAFDVLRGGEVSYTTWTILRSLVTVSLSPETIQAMS